MLRSYILTFALILGSISGMLLIAQSVPVQATHAVAETTISVQITGIRNTKGQIMLQLWNGPDGFPTKGDRGFKATNVAASKAVNGVLTVTFSVTPGTYAVSTLHDENSNGKMDSNALGIPKEGYGASNNPVTHFHAPSFDQAKFDVPASGKKISITMRY
jgi:uncharacterized protein (DUF2141 family)